jgi:hypothetical protein
VAAGSSRLSRVVEELPAETEQIEDVIDEFV